MNKNLLIITLFVALTFQLKAQTTANSFDVLVKGGHVIDPKNGIDAVMDVAIKAGKIVKVGKNLPAADARQVVDATGLKVVPGIIDMHAHVFAGTQPDHYLSDGLSALMPDGYTLVASGMASHVITPNMATTPFDPLKSFTHIANLGGPPLVLVVNPNFKVKSSHVFGDNIFYFFYGVPLNTSFMFFRIIIIN